MEKPCKTEDDCPTPTWCRGKDRCPKRDAKEPPSSRISHYLVSSYDDSVWVVFSDGRPKRFYGMKPPKKSKYPTRVRSYLG